MFKKVNRAADEKGDLQREEQEPVENEKVYNFTMGNVENSIATLFDDEFNSMQVYEYLLPKDLMPGQMVTVTFRRNIKEENERKAAIDRIHQQIMKEEEFAKSSSILRD